MIIPQEFLLSTSILDSWGPVEWEIHGNPPQRSFWRIWDLGGNGFYGRRYWDFVLNMGEISLVHSLNVMGHVWEFIGRLRDLMEHVWTFTRHVGFRWGWALAFPVAIEHSLEQPRLQMTFIVIFKPHAASNKEWYRSMVNYISWFMIHRRSDGLVMVTWDRSG